MFVPSCVFVLPNSRLAPIRERPRWPSSKSPTGTSAWSTRWRRPINSAWPVTWSVYSPAANLGARNRAGRRRAGKVGGSESCDRTLQWGQLFGKKSFRLARLSSLKPNYHLFAFVIWFWYYMKPAFFPFIIDYRNSGFHWKVAISTETYSNFFT